MAHREYEFSDSENEILRSFWRHATVWGVLCVGAAIACAYVGVERHGRSLLLFVAAAVELAIGVGFLFAGREVRLAERTRGHDIEHTMKGLRSISRALGVQIVVAAVSVGLVLIDAVLAVVR